MFAKAVELDPMYARAYAGMADCDSYLYMTYHEKVVMDDVLATTEKALSLDPRLAEAHASRGVALSAGQRYEEAKKEFEKALALDPDSYEAHYFYARSNFAQGNLKRAAALFERGAEIRPDDYQVPCLLVANLQVVRRPQDAQNAARKGVELAERELTLHPEDSGRHKLGRGHGLRLGKKIAPGNGQPVPWPSTQMIWSRSITLRVITRYWEMLTPPWTCSSMPSQTRP